jgi:cytochrome b561
VGQGARSLPRRLTLPRDVEIPALPGLGVTWYDRGAAYWARRAGMSLMWAFVLAIIAAIDSGLFGSIRQSSRTGFDVFIAIDAVLCAALLAWMAVRMAQNWNVAKPPGRAAMPSFAFGRGPARQLLGCLAQLGFFLLIPVSAFVLLVFPGLFIALFLGSLLPETLTERQARLLVAEQLRERGLMPETGGGG